MVGPWSVRVLHMLPTSQGVRNKAIEVTCSKLPSAFLAALEVATGDRLLVWPGKQTGTAYQLGATDECQTGRRTLEATSCVCSNFELQRHRASRTW